MPPIEAVISGIGGAFPQCDGMEDFVKKLLEGKNLSSVDNLRWEPGILGTSPHVGKITSVRLFDNSVFKVHKPLARLMDPLARLMLERSLEAIVDAGLSPRALDNTHTSVFMTTTVSESESRTTSILTSKKAGGYAIMAGSKTMMSNRISYFLNLKGPSITLDGDWTITLTALQRAARSIECGESDFALIGAANTCLFPELNKVYENFGVLSTDGQCRALDASASGCFRSEGAIVFLLQRADKANRIYGRIGGITELCVGTRSRFAGIDTRILPILLEDLYRSSGIDTKNVKLLATDGISNPDIERDEVEASAAVLCKTRNALPVSTAKTVAGHGDASGALVNMILAIASMEKGLIPPLKHYEQPHRDTHALKDGRMTVVDKIQPLALDANSAVAVNTLGFSGCIGHTILRPHAKEKQTPTESDEAYPRLIIVSGRTEEDAVMIANKIVDGPFDPEFIRLTQQAFSEPIPWYRCRSMAVIPSDVPDIRPIVASNESDRGSRPVWFVYSGMGSQWAGMGKGLLRLPEFAETMQRLQPVLEPEGIDLIHTITTDDSNLFENIVYSFISIAAVQIGLTNVLRSLGIKPNGIIGHSTGELGCAYGDGCLSEEETIRAAYGRGKASLAANLSEGMMASIGIGWKEAQDSVPPSIDVACHNAFDNCTISGPTDDVLQFVDELKAKNVFARPVNVSNIAFHSRYVKPAGTILKQYLDEIIACPKKRSERWVASSINPGDEDKVISKFAGPEFFTNNLLSPVRFEEAMKSVPPGAVVIELAPHGLMQPLIRRELPEDAVTLSLTQRGHRDGLRFLLENVGKLFLENVPLKPWVLAPDVPMPVSRGTAPLSSLVTWDHREEWPLVISTKSEISRPRSMPLYSETTPCITRDGKRCVAPAIFLEMVWKEVAGSKPLTQCPIVFEDLEITYMLEMHSGENMAVELVLQRETGRFELSISSEDYDNSVCILKGKVFTPNPTEQVGMMSAQPKEQGGATFDTEDIYAELDDSGLKYDDILKTLKCVTFNKTETVGFCCWSGKWSLLIDSLFQLSALTNSDGSIFCGKIRKLTIAPQAMRSISNALQVRHHLSTSVLAAPGINIEGYRQSETKKSSSSSILDLAVEPLGHHSISDAEDFLREVAMLRIQNSDASTSMFNILVLEKEVESVAEALQRALREAVGSQILVRKFRISPGEKIHADLKAAAVIVTDFSSMQVDRALRHFSKQAQPMVLRIGVRGGHNGYVSLASNLSDLGSLSVLIKSRQLLEEELRVVHILPGEHVPNDLQVPEGGEVLLVWPDLPLEGIFGAIACVRSRPYGARARIVIIKDKDAPQFSLHEDIYADRLSLGLFVNILQDGRWKELQVSKFRNRSFTPSRIEGYDTNIVGLNPSDLSQDFHLQLGTYDFCGHKDGTRFMGLARRSSDTVAVPDDILRWTVPSAWSDQQAASVPLAYCVAYHVLEILAKVQSGDRVLVMDGTSPVSQACIRVATHVGCEVISTVSSEEQRKQVISLNPQVAPERVLRSDKNTLKYFLKKVTNNKGFDVSLVPYCNGVIKTVFQCIAMKGRVFVMSKKNALAHQIGMFPFNDSAEMFGAGADALLTTSVRDKRAVQVAFQKGIASGVVQPLHSQVCENADDLDLATLKSPVKQLLRLRDPGNRPGMSFAILGGSDNSLVCMARAASSHGSSIVLASSRQGSPPSRAKLVPALRHTTFLPFPKSHKDAKHFISAASSATNIKAIVMNVEDAADHSLASLLNGALPTVNGSMRGVRLLVVTESLTLGTETVEAWRRQGLPACAVVGKARDVAHLLPTLLTISKLPTTLLTYQEGTDCRTVLGSPTLRTVRPETVQQHKPSRGSKTLVEVVSLAPRLRWRHNRLEPLPLVAVTGPALTASAVKEVAGKLLSPILMADGSQVTAQTLAQEVLRVQPRGPWAMYGDAGCADLLLHAANLVEKQAGRPDWLEVVHLALLELDNTATRVDEKHAGPLHFITQYDGEVAKMVALNVQKTRHFAADSSHIATILNDFLLSPMTKIISC